MRIDEPRRISRPIPLTPLIDVVFLLLMFFMLSTTFARFGQFGMGRTAEGAAAQSSQQAAEPGVIVEVSKGPAVRINGSRVELNDMVAKLNGFRGLGVTRGVVRPTDGATVQDLVTVLELARTSRIPSLALSQ